MSYPASGDSHGSEVVYFPSSKVNSSTVSPWPQGFDIDKDVVKQGEADNFKSKLTSALRTRGLHSVLLFAPPTLRQVLEANPELSNDEAVEYLDNFLATRNKDLAMVADLLPQTINMKALLLFERKEINKYINDGSGEKVYAWIVNAVDITKGRAQDRIRIAYCDVTVKNVKSADQIIAAVELKWWLYTAIMPRKPDYEGVREILVMLLGGPMAIRTNAANGLTTIEQDITIDGENWVRGYATMLRRFGAQLLSANSSSDADTSALFLMSQRVAELEKGGGKGGKGKGKGGYGGKGGKFGCGKNNCFIRTCDDNVCVLLSDADAGVNSKHAVFPGNKPMKGKDGTLLPHVNNIAIIQHARDLRKSGGIPKMTEFLVQGWDNCKDVPAVKTIAAGLKSAAKGALQVIAGPGAAAFGPPSGLDVNTGALLAAAGDPSGEFLRPDVTMTDGALTVMAGDASVVPWHTVFCPRARQNMIPACALPDNSIKCLKAVDGDPAGQCNCACIACLDDDVPKVSPLVHTCAPHKSYSPSSNTIVNMYFTDDEKVRAPEHSGGALMMLAPVHRNVDVARIPELMDAIDETARLAFTNATVYFAIDPPNLVDDMSTLPGSRHPNHRVEKFYTMEGVLIDIPDNGIAMVAGFIRDQVSYHPTSVTRREMEPPFEAVVVDMGDAPARPIVFRMRHAIRDLVDTRPQRNERGGTISEDERIVYTAGQIGWVFLDARLDSILQDRIDFVSVSVDQRIADQAEMARHALEDAQALLDAEVQTPSTASTGRTGPPPSIGSAGSSQSIDLSSPHQVPPAQDAPQSSPPSPPGSPRNGNVACHFRAWRSLVAATVTARDLTRVSLQSFLGVQVDSAEVRVLSPNISMLADGDWQYSDVLHHRASNGHHPAPLAAFHSPSSMSPGGATEQSQVTTADLLLAVGNAAAAELAVGPSAPDPLAPSALMMIAPNDPNAEAEQLRNAGVGLTPTPIAALRVRSSPRSTSTNRTDAADDDAKSVKSRADGDAQSDEQQVELPSERIRPRNTVRLQDWSRSAQAAERFAGRSTYKSGADEDEVESTAPEASGRSVNSQSDANELSALRAMVLELTASNASLVQASQVREAVTDDLRADLESARRERDQHQNALESARLSAVIDKAYDVAKGKRKNPRLRAETTLWKRATAVLAVLLGVVVSFMLRSQSPVLSAASSAASSAMQSVVGRVMPHVNFADVCNPDADDVSDDGRAGVVMPMMSKSPEDSRRFPMHSVFSGDHRNRPMQSSVAIAARKLGIDAKEYDNAEGEPFQDLSVPANQQPILLELQSGNSSGLHVAPPCTTFSVINDEQLRTLKHVRGRPDLSPEQLKKVDYHNALADFAIECCYSAYKGDVSFTLECPLFRGDQHNEPSRAFWPDKGDYPTIAHFPRMATLIATSGARVMRIALCHLGHEAQKYVMVIAWPPEVARHYEHLDGKNCTHVSHAQTIVGAEASAESRVYPPAFDALIAHSHVATHVQRALHLGVLAAMTGVTPNTVRMLSDNGATDCFLRSDEHCIPGTDGAPTVTSVMVGTQDATLKPQKSCVLPAQVPGTDRVLLIRVNIAPSVPIDVLSEGMMTEVFRAHFSRPPDEDWTMTLKDDGTVVPISPGPGRFSRLGFITFEINPSAASMLMLPVNDSANLNDWLEPAGYDNDEPEEGVLLLSAYTPAHVHMRQPTFNEGELLQLQHCRHMHSAIQNLIATHDRSITVGHDFGKITPKVVKSFCNQGCEVCNHAFMQPSPKGKAVARPSPDRPVGFFDSFGPVSTPAVYFGYTCANTTVFDPWGIIYPTGGKTQSTAECEQSVSEARAFVQPFKGEIAALRTDSLRATTTAKKWKEYAAGDTPFASQHTTPHTGHNALGVIERIHKDAWPMVLAALKMSRRGLKWWWVAWRHAILLLNIRATKRDGATELTSRWKSFFDVVYNQSCLRVLLSPCQYYVDKSQRYKKDAHSRHGMWCGISPDNAGAAWIWNGNEFITVDHGDVRTNEWLAWSITPVGTVAPDLLDDDGEFALFTDATSHNVCALVAPPDQSATALARAMEDARSSVIATATPATAMRAAAQAVSAANAAGVNLLPAQPPVEDASVARRQGVSGSTDVGREHTGFMQEFMADVQRRNEQDDARAAAQLPVAVPPAAIAVQPPAVDPPATVAANRARQAAFSRTDYVPARTSALAAHSDRLTRYAKKARGASMSLAADTLVSDVFVHGGDFAKSAVANDAYWEIADEYDQFDPGPQISAELSDACLLIAAGDDGARDRAARAVDNIDALVEARLCDLRVDREQDAYLMSMGPAADQFDSLFLLSSPGDDDHDPKVRGAVGYLGKMISLFNELGEPVQMDEPQTMRDVMRSPDKNAWIDTLVTEVTRLEDANTWLRVPRSAAAGQPIHKIKPVFVVKTDATKKFTKRRGRYVIIGTTLKQGRDYLEHFTAGASLPSIRQTCIKVVVNGWMRFRLDVTNAFPQHAIEKSIFVELPKIDGVFDWRDPVTGEQQIGQVVQNLYGTPQGPRTWTENFVAYHVNSMQMDRCVEDNKVFRKGTNTDGIAVAIYMDEAFGGGTPDRVKWYIEKMKERYPCTWERDWGTILGFGADVTDDNYLEFSTRKYTKEIADRFLPGESKPSRVVPSRESIEQLPAEIDKLPPLGSPEDLAMRPMQDDGRALNGALIHLGRGRCDFAYQSAICSQQAARFTHSGYEHLKEVARYAWANSDAVMRYCGPHCKSLVLSPQLEPIRPYDYDGRVEYGLYLIGDGAQATPNESVPNSKSMGGFAVMFGGAAIDWKSYRIHTCTPDSTSVETLVSSRLVSRGCAPRGVAQFLWTPQDKPTPLFTDNDGTWYVSREAASATTMVYIIRHVRFLQQATYDKVTKVFQLDGTLNPTDVFTKHLPREDYRRHMAFLMGRPDLALVWWRQSSKYKTHKYKKIVPVSPLEKSLEE